MWSSTRPAQEEIPGKGLRFVRSIAGIETVEIDAGVLVAIDDRGKQPSE
jgi:hypothetical protein